MRSRQRTIIWSIVGALAFLFLFSSTIAYYYTEVLWFRELGYFSVFLTRLGAQLAVGGGAALLYGLLLWLNLRVLRGSVMRLAPQAEELGLGAALRPRTVNRVIAGIAVLFGVVGGISFSSQWESLLRFIHQVPFGIADPIFGRDVGFYIFSLPVFETLYSALFFLVGALIVISAAVYFLTGSIVTSGMRVDVHPRARGHLAVLLAGFFLLRAWGYWLGAYVLMYSPRGVAFGASYTDIFAHLPALRVLMGLSVIAAILSILYARRGDIRWVYVAVALLLVGSVGLSSIYPAMIQRFVVDPNEIAREREYIEHNIEFTRKAFNLHDVVELPFPALETLTRADLENNRDTIDNVRIWDWRPMMASYRQLQSIRAYYDFHDVDVDRYVIDGEYRQVLISAREIDSTQVPGAQSWINQRLQYTHGHGVVMSPASRVSDQGLPVMWIEGIPPVSQVDLEITNPAIYYGEITRSYVIANSLEPELHYPEGDQNVYIQYDGEGGVPLGGFMRRVAMALRFNDYNIILSGALTSESRIMYHRQIRERVEHIAPFLTYDGDPYVVVHDGQMVWIQDAYTVSSRYPYSQPYSRNVNYIRNSVKIVIDAYNGDVMFYVFDEQDPMIQVYQNIFPDLFVSQTELPEGLRAHVRYPLDYFTAQMDMFRTYHMLDPVVFYNKEDLWEIPEEIFAGSSQLMEPYYIMMNLPDSDVGLEYLLMMPYTPTQREVMVAWMVGRSDGDNYGELLVYNMPKGRTVLGPRQVEARIDQDSDISQLLTLWGQGGSRVIRGSMMVVPVEDSLLYIEPVYLEAADTQIPELRRVIVVFGNRLVMGNNLDQALDILFGGRPVVDEDDPDAPSIIAPDADAALVERANDLFRRSQEALRAGQWSQYGTLMEELGQVLDDLVASVSPGP